MPVSQPSWKKLQVNHQSINKRVCYLTNLSLERLQDLVNLAPRKPDWDLKRDVAKKLAKLDKRTQRAIAILIRERLIETKQDNLAAAVNALN